MSDLTVYRHRNRSDEPSIRCRHVNLPRRRAGVIHACALGIAFLGLWGMSWPQVPVGTERQLFVDRTMVSEMSGLELKLHSPRLREEVLDFDRPWEGGNSWASSVLRDGVLYRMWYESQSGIGVKPGWSFTAYAESRDGIHWKRPALGRIEFQGSKENNLVWDGVGGNMSVFKDERPGVPDDQRYKAVTRGRGAWGLVSADGLDWRLVQEDPILTGGAFDSHNIVFQDPWTLEYRYFGRGFVHEHLRVPFDRDKHERGTAVRRIRYATSRDFLRWTPLKLAELPAEPLDHLYTNAAVPYGRAKGIYFMATGIRDRRVQRNLRRRAGASGQLEVRDRPRSPRRETGPSPIQVAGCGSLLVSIPVISAWSPTRTGPCRDSPARRATRQWVRVSPG